MIIGPNDGWTGVFFKFKDELLLVDSSKKGHINYRRIDDFLLTHSHLDHCYFAGLEGDYPVYCSRFSKDFLCDPRVRRRLHRVPSEDRFVVVKPGERIEVGGLEAEPVPVEHSCPEAFAWVVEDEHHRVLVTGDWYDPPEGERVIDRLASVEPDVLITESTRAPTYTPDTPMANLGRLEWVKYHGYENVVLLANWQHVELVRQFAEVFGTPYVWFDDPLRVACEIEGVGVKVLKKGDDVQFPLITSMDARVPSSADCVVFEFSHHPKVQGEISKVRVSLGGHACRTEIKMLVEEAKPDLVVFHHGADNAMKGAARWFERVLKVETTYWPSTGNPAVLSIKLD